MLLIQHNQPKVLDRRKNCRAGSQNHGFFALVDFEPGAETFRIRQAAVQNFKPVAEVPLKKTAQLLGERNFGHQADRGAAACQHFAHAANIKFGFAAAGDPVD